MSQEGSCPSKGPNPGPSVADTANKDGQPQKSPRDSGYVSVSQTPHFQLGPDVQHDEENTFSFDEDLCQQQGACGPSDRNTDVFSAMDSTHGNHHIFDVLTPLSSDTDCAFNGSKPIDIPTHGRSRRHAQKHDNFTPPRGYIYIQQAHHRYSTGSLPPLQSLHTQSSVQSQASVQSQVSGGSVETTGREIVDNAIKLQEGFLRHTEEKLLQKGRVVRRQRFMSECPPVKGEEEEEGEDGAAGMMQTRGRSQSVPIMPQSDLQKLYGQELRRIADEFHCSNICLDQLYHAPTPTHVRHHSESYPRTAGHQRGWWQHIIQFISPRRRTFSCPSSSSVTDLRETLAEAEID